ncbi:Ppx/GppA phosphatase family protein [Hoyosella altamirensis]|uniref:Exopolyphosphatase/guanosine-5'-triphosphate, 3'-diphosphate pyrophosphatase n=1 Tax=Hoyosella altamirensis TaxID=616997 RepID=A0A839RIW4_9ACTN|nr:Ppx/GppA phosphatase family protein [Hoyosella altamirensis]MBB3035971.1 exopolyphosphatase/guanosine-5'-triphosphate,3'-diphosphate pyrophosphatase [Hoyosella altamirensis]
MTRVAAIDCGTNSLRLLIADVEEGSDGSQKLTDVDRRMVVVRLGQGVDATGEFHVDALARTRRGLQDYARLIADSGATRLRMVATSATRDASNRDAFFAMTREILDPVIAGSEAEVISGDEEAELSFIGAVADLDPAEGPFVVVDLGGGSTEVVYGSDSMIAARSVNVGCVRLTERCLHHDPPTDDEVREATHIARSILRDAFSAVPLAPAHTWVGVAGTMTTLSALAHDMSAYDSEKIHLSRVPFPRLLEVCDDLVHMTRARRMSLGPMHPGRADVIGGGAIITRVLAEELSAVTDIDELVVSEHDILDGIAYALAKD